MTRFQLVWRRKKPYIRLMPYTVENPTEAQQDIRDAVREAVRIASSLTTEEVAELIGGTVAGRNLVYYNGDLLPTQAAVTKWIVEGMKSPKTKKRVPKWVVALEQYLKIYNIPEVEKIVQ
jgi:hypothetical protein